MSTIINIPTPMVRRATALFQKLSYGQWVVVISIVLAIVSTIYSVMHGYSIAYGDAESHLNIAKRVIHSITPGFAQLGGIWLPLPHLFLIPFVYFDFLWRTGLAGAIVSGIAYVISCLYIFKLVRLLTENNKAALMSSLVFATNPNILYLQTTPMTELPLIVFFILSSYYFILFMKKDGDVLSLILAALFGFCASLSRYDGWALVMMEAGVIVLYYIWYTLLRPWVGDGKLKERLRLSWTGIRENFDLMEGRLILFSSLAFLGILIWLVWGYLILGDALYFTHSEFSASSQQQSWDARGELPARHDVLVSLFYYFMTSVQSVGMIVAVIAIIGLVLFLRDKLFKYRFLILLILMVPFFFNVLTLYLGQSVIFIPSITPPSFEWQLFNVRYGVLMIAPIAVIIGYLFARSHPSARACMALLVAMQMGLFAVGFSPVLSFDDGVHGLSSAVSKLPDAQAFVEREYDYGMVLTDDFARTISIVRSPIKMQDVIYVGNKPYWEESLVEPHKYARWIFIQRNDTLWKNLIDRPEVQARLYNYFNRTYTSEDILIFRRIDP